MYIHKHAAADVRPSNDCMYAQPDDLLLHVVCCRVNAVVPSGILTEAIKAYAAGVGMTLDDVVNNQSNHMIIQRHI